MRLRADGFWREPPSDTIIIAEPAVSSMLDLLFLSDNLAISSFSAVFHKFVSSDLCGSSTNGGKLFSPKYPPGALASVLGCVVTLQLGAFSVVLETTLSGITALPLGAFAALMQPIHLAIGLVEGLITAAVLLFVYQTRPELLQGAAGTGAKNRCSRKAALAILAAAALVIGGGLSLLASSPGRTGMVAVPGCRLSACRASDASVLSEAAHGAAARVRGRAFKSAV